MESPSPTFDVAALVEEHYDFLYRYAYRLSGTEVDAEDIVQQTFLAVQRNVGQVRDQASVKAWLCTILRNAFLKRLRDRPPGKLVPLELVAEPQDNEPEEILVESEELQAALQELPEEFRTVIVLFYFGDFSYKAIADQLDIPIGTVMSRLSRGKSWLRRRLAACLSGSSRPES